MSPSMNKSWRCLPFIALLLPGITTFAQKVKKADTIFTSDGVDVYIRRNRSHKLTMIAEARLVDLESSVTDPARVCTGLNGDFFFKRFASINGNFKGAVYSLQSKFAEENNKSQNKLNPFMAANIGARVHFIDGKGSAWKKVTLGVYNDVNDNGSLRTTFRYLRAKYPCRRVIGARTGFFWAGTPVSADMNGDILKPDVKGNLRSTDGTLFSGHYYTNSATSGYYLGLTRIINMNIRVSSNVDTFEGKGKHIGLFREMYADILFGNTRFDPMRTGGQEHAIEANTTGSFNVSNIGWRLGGRAFSTRNPTTLGAWYEIGMRPGIVMRSFYVSAGITLTYVK